MSEKEPKPLPPLYTHLYIHLTRVALEHGYALALHGSMARDLDVIAVAWTEDAAPAEELLAAFVEELDSRWVSEPEQKPRGRRAWTMTIPRSHAVVDLSIIEGKP